MAAQHKPQLLVLLDAHAILHRAYHALPEFTSSKGEPTGGLYGIAMMLMKLVEEFHPDHIIACYDLPEPTHRHKVFEEYKAGRAEADDALVAQMERSRDLFEAFNVSCLDAPGFEADDILGTLVEQAKTTPNLSILIASGDMDTLQLVDKERVRVYTLKKGIKDTIVYDEAGVVERFGFGPELLPDFKGLRGDPSDNIPGIKGIGEKTATELIVKFGGIDALYKTTHSKPDELARAGITPRIQTLITEGEDEARFSKELATIRRDAPATLSLPNESWREGFGLGKALALLTELEFRSLVTRVRTIVGDDAPLPQESDEETEDVDEQELYETGVALWVLDSDRTNPTLEDMLEHTGASTFRDARTKIFEQLHETGLITVFDDIERPLIAVVKEMETHGALLDVSFLKTLSTTYHKKLTQLENAIHKHAGRDFNINSPKQLGDVLFDELTISQAKMKRTATGQRSTREAELVKLKDAHPIVNDILAYRELQKLLSTYIDTLLQAVDANDRLHAQFQQTGTTTGRMSSQHPNLQNIPIRTEDGRAIRHAFIAPPEFMLLAADYSQIELRIAAFLSEDEKLIAAFKHGGDIHTAVAAEVFNVPPELVDKEMRRRAKVINFGILYGMGVTALQQNLGSTRQEATTFLSEYFKRFAGIASYVEVVKAEVHTRGYTETLFGRRRSFEGIRSPLPYVQAQAERMAINAPIQGTQADIIKIAMVRINEHLLEHSQTEDAHLVLQVHDELVYEVRTKKLPEIAAAIKNIMESVVPAEKRRNVPIIVDVETGPNWGDMTRYDIPS